MIGWVWPKWLNSKMMFGILNTIKVCFFSVVWFLSFWANGQGCVWFHWFKHWNISRFLDLASRSKDREDPNRCVINGAERLLVTPFHAPHKIIRTQEATLNDWNQTITVTSPEMKTKFIRPHPTEECFQKHHCHLAKIWWNCETTFVWLRNVSILNHATSTTCFPQSFVSGCLGYLAQDGSKKKLETPQEILKLQQNNMWKFNECFTRCHEHVIKTYDSCNLNEYWSIHQI